MRVVNRLLSALLALALLVAGLVLALEILLTSLLQRPVILPYRQWLDYGRRTSWDNGMVRVTALIVMVIGVLLLLSQLRRTVPKGIAGEDVGPVTVMFARKPLERALSRLAERGNGVENVGVRLARRRAKASGASLASDLKRAESELETLLEDGLQRLPLKTTPNVSVNLRRARS